MTQLPKRPMSDVRDELKDQVGTTVRSRLSAIYDLARRGRTPVQIVRELGLSQSDTQDVARAIQALGLKVEAKHQFADMDKIRDKMLKKRFKP